MKDEPKPQPKRTKRITVRVTPSERQVINEKAEQARRPLSDYARDRMLAS